MIEKNGGKNKSNDFVLKIIIFFTIVIASTTPFIIFYLVQDGNARCENCFIESIGINGMTAIIKIDDDIEKDAYFLAGDKISVTPFESNEKNTSLIGVVINKKYMEEPVEENSTKAKSFCISVKIDENRYKSLRIGERVIICKADTFRPLRSFF